MALKYVCSTNNDVMHNVDGKEPTPANKASVIEILRFLIFSLKFVVKQEDERVWLCF